MNTWQLQEAKARFSELVKRAESEGPQDITVHGRSVAVLVSRSEFARLSQHQSFADFMRASPLFGMEDLALGRDLSWTRDVAL